MTCIIGLVHDGAVYIGADSAGVAGMSLTVRADEKVFRLGKKMVVGFTSSFRMGQLIRYRMQGVEPPARKLTDWMVTEFVDRCRDVMSDGGFLEKKNDRISGGSFLVGVHGRLFAIFDDFQVSEAAEPFDAVGCGHDLAKGAMFATPGCQPRNRVMTALRAAEAMSAAVRRPFRILMAAP
jgi:ATP-dependent protease HslVU (ClpYQ) peptidase subunit